MPRFWSIVLWGKYFSTGLNTAIHSSIWRCMAVLIKWQHHNCPLSLTNGLYHYNVVGSSVPFHPYNTLEDIVQCSSRTSKFPLCFCFRKIPGLKSISHLIQFAPDLLACQFASQIEFSWTATLMWCMWLCDPIICAEVFVFPQVTSWKDNYCFPWT